MIIKATRLQAWAPADWGSGGKSRPSPPPFDNKKKFFCYIGQCFFATFSSYGGLFATFFSFLRAFSPCGGLFATFFFMVGVFFWACPPSLQKFLLAPMIVRGFESILPEIFCVTAI